MSSQGGTTYSVDTSTLIAALDRSYREERFPSLWAKVDELISAGRFKVSAEVWEEVQVRDDVVAAWMKDRREGIIVPTDGMVAERVRQILDPYPLLVKELKGRNRADPFVIAVAQVLGATVVTEESRGGEARPKIPLICERLGVVCIDFPQLISNEDWSF